MTVTVEHTTEVIGGKEYPLIITKQRGFQEIEVHGEKVAVESLTIFDSPMGRSRCYTRARPGAEKDADTGRLSPAAERRIAEVAAQAMLDQGI